MDYKLDRIGERLDHPEIEPVLAADDQVRVDWVVAQYDRQSGIPVVDIGASDGAVSDRMGLLSHQRFLVDPHPAHWARWMGLGWGYHGNAAQALRPFPALFFHTGILCEVLEHLDLSEAQDLLRAAKHVCSRLIVTVPNVHARSYEATGRSRWNWPDHLQTFTAETFRDAVGVDPEPIVGLSIHDSIWLGAVWRA